VGYKYAAKDLRFSNNETVLDWIEQQQQHQNSRIIFAGHSFGAGLSIALSEFCVDAVVYAMGSPCIGNTRYIQELRKTRQIHLLSTTQDPVSVSDMQERAGYDCVLTCLVQSAQEREKQMRAPFFEVYLQRDWNSYNWVVSWNYTQDPYTPLFLKFPDVTVRDHLSYLKKSKQVYVDDDRSILQQLEQDDSWTQFEPLALRIARRICMFPFYASRFMGVEWATQVRQTCFEKYLSPLKHKLEPLYFVHGIYASHPLTFEFYRLLKSVF